MVSKSQIKFITSLRQKKYRDKHKLFVAEGPKVIEELYQSGLQVFGIFSTEPLKIIPESAITPISNNELKKISTLKTSNIAVGVFYKPAEKPLKDSGVTVVLDSIRDPGNLGTIIRLCDWFGVENLVCSEDTADCYNPKVIQSTMGSIARVGIHYMDVQKYLQDISRPVLGAFMDGNNVYKTSLPENAVLIMGNEANGISSEIEKLVTERISIPRFGDLQKTESLNVATATAILLSELHRSTER